MIKRQIPTTSGDDIRSFSLPLCNLFQFAIHFYKNQALFYFPPAYYSKHA